MVVRVSFVAGALGALAFALGAWRLLPDRVEPGPRVRAIVCDVSESLRRTSPTLATRLRHELADEVRAAREAGEEVLVALASAEVQLAFGPGPAEDLRRRLEGVDGAPFDPTAGGARGTSAARLLGTDLARALRAAERAIDERGASSASVLILGDGTFTGEDPASDVARLVGRGYDWRGVRRIESERPDAALLELAEDTCQA